MTERSSEAIAAARRYDLITNYRAGSSIEEMEPADDGEWIRWEDAAAEIRRLSARCAALEQALRGWQKIPRPWIDGGVTWAEWDAACTAIEVALSTPSEEPQR